MDDRLSTIWGDAEGNLHRLTTYNQHDIVPFGSIVVAAVMRKETAVKIVIFVLFLLYSNPKRAELDGQLRSTFNHNFVKGVAKYLNVNLREAFGGETYESCILFSYLKIGKKSYYVGIGGIWIDPNFWSTVSGLAVIMTTLFSIARVAVIDEVLSVFFSTLMFVTFSEPVELRMGRSNMATFLLFCTLGSLAVVRSTTMIRRLQDVPVDIIIRACGSACLCYLAVAANNPNKNFVIDGLTIPKAFRWNGLQVDYSQIASMDFLGLAGSATGALAEDLLQWISD